VIQSLWLLSKKFKQQVWTVESEVFDIDLLQATVLKSREYILRPNLSRI
jgi:hypothetical protein